jgi:hypothetical protein
MTNRDIRECKPAYGISKILEKDEIHSAIVVKVDRKWLSVLQGHICGSVHNLALAGLRQGQQTHTRRAGRERVHIELMMH